MYGPDSDDPNVMYYLTVSNEPIMHLRSRRMSMSRASCVSTASGRATVTDRRSSCSPQGWRCPWAIEAADLLREEWGVSADVWSVTFWTELRRDGLRVLKHDLRHPEEQPQVPYVTTKLAEAEGPIIASSDYMSDMPDQIRAALPNPFATLGADEHSFSDTRPAARGYFHIYTHSMVVRALQMLAEADQIDAEAPGKAAERYRLLDVTAGSTGTAGGES
jgi:pyruvate dehydrogenase E1 component